LRILLPDRTITAEINAKSLHKAQTAVREQGADNIALALQGHFVGDAIAEAGPSAQPRARNRGKLHDPHAAQNAG
jgi:hypothetical protein